MPSAIVPPSLYSQQQQHGGVTTDAYGGPPSTGSQLRRRYMPQQGGASGPIYGGPKPGPGAGGGGWSPVGGTPNVPTPWGQPGPSQDKRTGISYPTLGGNKGGGVFNENSPPSWTPASGSPPPPGPWSPDTAHRPMGGMFGGFNPSQLMQQGGQWGGMGPGGNFQALGGNALQRWLASQGGAPTPTATNTAPPPPPSQGGYVTADQFTNPAYNWFRQGEGAAGHPTDFNAFNDWFHNFGQAFDQNAWNRLYGMAGSTTDSL